MVPLLCFRVCYHPLIKHNIRRGQCKVEEMEGYTDKGWQAGQHVSWIGFKTINSYVSFPVFRDVD